MIVFSVFFRLLLMKETFFRFTRFTLLSGLIVCSILPLIKIETTQTYSLQQPVFHLEETLLAEKINAAESSFEIQNKNSIQTPRQKTAVSQTTKTKRISWYSIFIATYWFGLSLMVLRFVISLFHIRNLISTGRIIYSGNCKLVITQKTIVAFSFFRYIVLSEKDYRENPEEIILHEKMHMLKKHNLDVIFAELFLIVHWCNPMVWLLSRDLREIHEYEADKAVLDKGIDATRYQLLLVKKVVGERRFTSVVNSFNQSKIKNRITMMLQKKSSKWARIKVLMVVPLMAVMLIAFAQPEIEKKAMETLQQNPKSTEEQVLANPLFYWEQMQKFLSEKGIEPNNLKRTDFGKNENLVVLLINSKNQVMYRNSSSDTGFKTPEEAKSDASVQALKKIITESMDKSGNNPLYFHLQNDVASSTKFIVHFINTTLPKAYDGALNEMSTRKNVSVNELKEKYPLLLFYHTPMVYAGNANKRVSAKEDNNKTFKIRTSAEKDGKEEMAFWKIVRDNEGNGIQTVTIRQEVLSGSEVMEEKSLAASTIIEPSDFALVGVGTDLNKTDIDGMKTHILDKRLKPQNSYFILSI